MAKSFSLLFILLPLLFTSFTSTHAFHVPGHFGFHPSLLPLRITSPCAAPLSILPHLGFSPFQTINPYYPYPTLALPPYQAIKPFNPYPTLASPYISYNQLAGGVSAHYYGSQVLGTAPLFNQLQANQVFNQMQANQLFQQQQANQVFNQFEANQIFQQQQENQVLNQFEANQLFSQLQANQVFNQQQANQLFMTSQLANYLPIPSAIGYPSAYAHPTPRGVVA